MCISKILRLVLTTVCGLSFILGAALAGIGLWIMVSKDDLRKMINLVDAVKLPGLDESKEKATSAMDKYDILSTVGLAFLIIGSFIAGVSFCGGVGAMCSIKILLLVYIIATGVLLTVLVIGIIYFGTFKARLDEQILKQLRTMQDKYVISLISLMNDKGSVKTAITGTFNFMQLKLQCCGVDAVGDARNSSSWQASERRLSELSKQGISFDGIDKKTAASRARREAETGFPEWLKAELPAEVKTPPSGMTIEPKQLPPGFKLPDDFKAKLKETVSGDTLDRAKLQTLLNSTMTIQTPLTCCKIDNPDELLSGSYDVKKVYGKLGGSSECVFSKTNKMVNEKTCFQAVLDYIGRYQNFVVSVGTILAIVVGAGTGAALWIYCFD